MTRFPKTVDRRPPGATASAPASSPRPAAGARTTLARFDRIAIALIDVPADRLRPVRQWRVETLRKEIGDGGQPQHPINVAAEATGRFTLISGAARLAAVELGGAHDIDARVIPASTLTTERRRLLEITENLNREELTKLERAENLVELKRVHEALHPETRKGGRRGNQHTGGVKRQSEIFAFSQEAAEITGLSRRAIEAAVAIVAGLSNASKARLRGTWLEDHQAGLKLLSEQTPHVQDRICDMLFAVPPEAATVADALVLAEGRRLPTTAEKLFASTVGNWSRLSARQRADFLDSHEPAIREHARKRGWF